MRKGAEVGMKKKTYKRMKNKLYREMVKCAHLKFRAESAEEKAESAEEKAESAEKEAEKYKERFHKIGSNIKTIETGKYGPVVTMKWEIKPEQWGNYIKLPVEAIETMLRNKIIDSIAKGLIENNIIQFIIREPNENNPLERYGTYAAKMYVVPWEQMAEKGQIELIKADIGTI